MKYFKAMVVSGAAFLGVASIAEAQVQRDFVGVQGGSVTVGGFDPEQIPKVNGQIDGVVDKGSGQGGSVKAIVNLNSSLVTFESGTASVGADVQSYSRSGINLDLTNTGDGNIALRDFTSTIIPAGMGFFVQDRNGNPTGGNPFTGYGQSQTVAFGDFFLGNGGTIAANQVFARAEFDFEVLTNEAPLYLLNGIVSLSFDNAGLLQINETLTGPSRAGQFLNGFRTALNNHHALAYDWQATDIILPLSDFGLLTGFETRQVTYRADVTSWTTAPCINNGLNCIVAYAGFGDPIGRGGGDTEAASFVVSAFSPDGDITPLHVDNPADDGFVIGGINFQSVTVNVAAVPEPSTWAVMIIGFGMAGAALRRRRRVAYS